MELAITIPLIVLPIAVALIDLSMNMRQERKANAIVKSVAKFTSTQTVNTSGRCGNTAPVEICPKNSTPLPHDSLQTFGQKNLCSKLVKSNFNTKDWISKVEIIEDESSPSLMIPQQSKGYNRTQGSPEQLVKVSLESKKPFCILCLGTSAKVITSSVYALQSRCIYE